MKTAREIRQNIDKRQNRKKHRHRTKGYTIPLRHLLQKARFLAKKDK